ncbi:hypothetical protein N9P61_02085 [Flavobacteriaceae bacterium]|nr:hypothetical protein [Flavobacteriaceae bacterium]
MKNVLIICSIFPPQSAIGGLRAAMFTKYLRDYGWNPYVLTRTYSKDDSRYDENMDIDLGVINNQIFRVKHSLIDEKKYLEKRTLIGKIRDFFYPEFSTPAGLYFKMKESAEVLIEKHKFDLILSTVPDQECQTLGSFLSKKYKIPFIADFRDIKEQDEGLNHSLRDSLQRLRFLIRRYVTSRNASILTTVSEYHASILSKKLYRKTEIIYNGYDDDIFKTVESGLVSSRVFKIIYVGRILDIWYRDPTILLRAIDSLIKEHKILYNEVCIEFYGSDREKLEPIISQLENNNFIKFFPRIAYSDVPRKLNEAQMLLLLTNRGRKGILTTKFFEYAGVNKPILCVPGDGDELDTLISKYNLGYSIANIEELKSKIIEWLSLYKDGNFPKFIDSDIAYFTRRNQTKKLSELFNSVIK